MPIDKDKSGSETTESGLEEAQGAYSAPSASAPVNRQDFEGLRHELDGRIVDVGVDLHREMNEQKQLTRGLIDDVQKDVRCAEAKLEWRIKTGFAMVNHKFNVLALSNTSVIIAVMGFMYFLFRP